jgi:hypothetical protein
MKRTIKTYRRVLLDAEEATGELRYNEAGSPSEVYHARLLDEGKHLHLVDGMDEVVITGLTSRGHDLLDLIRDGDLLAEVQDELIDKGLDSDHLEAVVFSLREKLSVRLAGQPVMIEYPDG